MSTFINFVLILSVSVSRTTRINKGMSLKDQLARSLNNVGEIINNIEDKIDQERKILSQIEFDLNHQRTGANVDFETTNIWWDSTTTTNTTLEGQTATTPSNEEIPTTKTLFPKYFVTTPSTFPTLPNHWNVPTSTPPDSPFVKDLKKTMALDGHGYFTAFLTRATELIYTTDPAESYPVIEQLNLECQKYLDEGKFYSLGETLTTAMQTVLTEWFPKLTPYLMNQQAGVLHFILKDKNKTVPSEMNDVLNFYDELFTQEEGQQLFTSLELLYEYPNVNLTAAELSQSMFAAAIAPYIKIEGKRQQKRLIQLVYMALEDFAPYFRAVATSSFENSEYMKDNQSTLSVRRSINNKNKVSQDKLFPSKHPKLLKKTKRQYKRHKKRNYHHLSQEWKHHHRYRDRHGGHRRYLYDRDETRLSSVRSNEPDEAVEEDASESNGYYDSENDKAHHQKNTQTRQRTKRNKKRRNKLRQHRQKRMKTNQRQRRQRNGISRTANGRQDNLQYNKQLMTGFLRKKQQKQSFKRFNVPSSEAVSSQYSQDSIKKDLLHKIREVSSYSDEEEHLKNNLYDALRHGNRTIVSFRKAGGDINNKYTLRDVSSETDEEWVFKNNIYKVFEQI